MARGAVTARSAVVLLLRLVRTSILALLRLGRHGGFFLGLGSLPGDLGVALLPLLSLDVIVTAMRIVTLLRHVAPVRNEICYVDSYARTSPPI